MTTKFPIPAETREAIEQHWVRRANMQRYKPGSVTYAKAECEFFSGAMAALDTQGFEPSPKWVLNLMSRRSALS